MGSSHGTTRHVPEAPSLKPLSGLGRRNFWGGCVARRFQTNWPIVGTLANVPLAKALETENEGFKVACEA